MWRSRQLDPGVGIATDWATSRSYSLEEGRRLNVQSALRAGQVKAAAHDRGHLKGVCGWLRLRSKCLKGGKVVALGALRTDG